ncbi:DUF5667 domain-containing protein [Nocardioides zeicaulis]|uniref:DUF5667 domain-containing protein n=1 Tax=Nocardioides zeicaulis TaxID=1776857 RepID=A0ABV6E320_9ACTN
MTPAFSARRRADELEALLSRAPGTPLDARDLERHGELLRVVADLRALPEVSARPEFVSDLRERLMAETDTVLVRRPAAPERLAMPSTAAPRRRGLAVVLGSAAMVGAAATMAVASQGALPGESLYGVKRGIESAQVRLADSDSERGRALLAQARTRLDELESLAAEDRAPEALVPETLDTFTRQSSEGMRSLIAAYDDGGSRGDVQHARDFAATSIARLETLQTSLPTSARDALVAAGRALTDLDLEAGDACPACGGGVTTTPEFLLSGAPVDLMSGLDTDDVQLEAAPVSGQDLSGVTVPPQLQTGVAPTAGGVPTGAPTGGPTGGPSGGPTPTPTGPVPTLPSPTPTKGGGQDPVTELTDGVTTTVTGTTSTVITGLDDATGGAIGGLTGTLDDATGGLINDVTGTVNGATGNLLGDATGGLLP